jgi:hypothetical protein
MIPIGDEPTSAGGGADVDPPQSADPPPLPSEEERSNEPESSGSLESGRLSVEEASPLDQGERFFRFLDFYVGASGISPLSADERAEYPRVALDGLPLSKPIESLPVQDRSSDVPTWGPNALLSGLDIAEQLSPRFGLARPNARLSMLAPVTAMVGTFDAMRGANSPGDAAKNYLTATINGAGASALGIIAGDAIFIMGIAGGPYSMALSIATTLAAGIYIDERMSSEPAVGATFLMASDLFGRAYDGLGRTLGDIEREIGMLYGVDSWSRGR